MRIPRVYIAQPLAENHTVAVEASTTHYLTRVLRLGDNAPLIVFNGEGGEYKAKLTQIEKRRAMITIGSFHVTHCESSVSIHLLQALAKGEKMDFIIQKACELGVSDFTPLLATRCDVKLDPQRTEKRLQHWQSVAISAAEQCGRTTVMTINPPATLQHRLAQHPEHLAAAPSLAIVATPQGDVKLPDLSSDRPPGQITVAIGPEGGFNDCEIQFFGSHNFHAVKLGPRTLRTETAPIAVLAAIHTLFGDFR